MLKCQKLQEWQEYKQEGQNGQKGHNGHIGHNGHTNFRKPGYGRLLLGCILAKIDKFGQLWGQISRFGWEIDPMFVNKSYINMSMLYQMN